MSEQTNHMEQIQHLDFPLGCQSVYDEIRDGKWVRTYEPEHSGAAVADVVFETWNGEKREKFMCARCLHNAEEAGQVIYVHRVG